VAFSLEKLAELSLKPELIDSKIEEQKKKQELLDAIRKQNESDAS
jgi:hypothetical protein